MRQETDRPVPARRAASAAAPLMSAEFGLVVLLVLFCVGFAQVAQGFTSLFNLFTLTRLAAVNIVIGLSMMTVIVTGGLDLSVGAIGVVASMVAGWLLQVLHLPVPLAILGALVAGCALGLANGVLIVRSGMHSFVITLGTMSVFFGIMIVVTRAEAFRNLPDSFAALARLRWFHFVSPMLLVSLGAAALLQYLYRLTDIGRQMLAAGANARAAMLSGVNVRRIITLCHGLAGLLAALAGIMVSVRNGAIIPSMAGNLGQDWLLPAFLAPVLGGTLLEGGKVSVGGTVLGAILVTVLGSGLLLLHVGEFWVQFFLGALLLVAVLLERGRLHLLSGRTRAR